MVGQLLSGKVVLITGAARNLGEELSYAFARAGAAVAINTRSNMEQTERVAENITRSGGRAIAVRADVKESGEVECMAKTIEKSLGPISILVNNATCRHRSDFVNISMRQWREVIDTILTGTFLCTRSVLPHMLSQSWGRIINIGASAAQKGRGDRAHQMAAKMGVIGLTKSLAVEYAKKNITVNCVAPGVIRTVTPSSENRIKQLEEQLQEIPMGRLGRVEEVAPVCVFLASDQASYITGQVIGVNGGFYL